jgi:hypothetical protein
VVMGAPPLVLPCVAMGVGFTEDQRQRARDLLGDRLRELRRANYNNAQNALGRLVHVLRDDPIVSSIVSGLPPVDFDAWYDQAMETTRGGMSGSGRLTWPLDEDEDLSLRLRLIEEVAANNRVRLLDFAIDFGLTHSTNLSECVQGLVDHVAEPAIEQLERRVDRLEVRLLPSAGPSAAAPVVREYPGSPLPGVAPKRSRWHVAGAWIGEHVVAAILVGVVVTVVAAFTLKWIGLG